MEWRRPGRGRREGWDREEPSRAVWTFPPLLDPTDRLPPRPPPAETLIYYLSHSKLKGITAERTDGRERGEPGEETPRLPRCAFSPPLPPSRGQSVRASSYVWGRK